jgi:hypothetical protein
VSEFRLLQLGCRLDETGIAMVHEACRRLARFTPATVVPAVASGLKHEAGTPSDRAATFAQTLTDGAVAILANGPPWSNLSAGDVLLGQMLPFLPRRRDLTGVVIGAMCHGHVLTALSHRYPMLKALMGPPIAEVIGVREDTEVAVEAARRILELFEAGPPNRRLSPDTVRCAAFLAGSPGTDAPRLAPSEPISPTVLRSGRAAGRVIAGNLAAVALLAGSDDWPRGGILLVEACELRLIHVDRLLQRLRIAGVLPSLDALLIGAPLRLVRSARALSVVDIVSRAVEGTSYPVAVDAFLGSGFPSPLLRLGARAEVSVDASGIELSWSS